MDCSDWVNVIAITAENELILVEQFPKLEGRQMVMMIAPGKKKQGGAAKPVQEATA